jgi:hypothetical protein
MERCNKGTHRNKKTGECDEIVKMKRCKNGTHMNKITDNCDEIVKKARCGKGTHRNKKTGDCEAIIRKNKSLSRTLSSPAKKDGSPPSPRRERSPKDWMEEKERKLLLMYRSKIQVSDSTVKRWLERSTDLDESDENDAFFISKIRTVVLTEGLIDEYIRVSGHDTIERDCFNGCMGNMPEVAQSMLFYIIGEFRRHYERGDLYPEEGKKLIFEL